MGNGSRQLYLLAALRSRLAERACILSFLPKTSSVSDDVLRRSFARPGMARCNVRSFVCVVSSLLQASWWRSALSANVRISALAWLAHDACPVPRRPASVAMPIEVWPG